MRVLIYSDVHANLEALQAMIEATTGRYDASVCLGDMVGYGANPNETTAWVRQNTPVVIRGNHDRACASLDGIGGFNASAAAAALWTHAQLEAAHTEWLQALPAGPFPWHELSLVHGSPLDEDEYLLQVVQAAGSFAATVGAQQWFGHSHLQGGFTLADDQVQPWLTAVPGENPPPEAKVIQVQLQPGSRYLLNPGSVGQPRDGDWRAAFAILDEGSQQVEFHRIPYDVAGAQRRILDAGLPERLAARLSKGR
ncbi:MAG: metallophosphoesterase family protein [Terriglobales bacterium]